MWTIKSKIYSFVFSSVPRNGSCKNTSLNLNLTDMLESREHRLFLYLFKTLSSEKMELLFHFYRKKPF